MLDEFWDSRGGAFLDVGDRIADVGRLDVGGVGGVHDVDRDVGADKIRQRSRRIDIERSAYDDEYVSALGYLDSLSEHRDRLAEKDYIRAEERAVGMAGVERLFPAIERHSGKFVARAAELGDLAMEVSDVLRAGALVEIVDVLRDDMDIVSLLELGEGNVGRVRLFFEDLAAALVIEIYDQFAVAGESLRSADILNTVVCPKTVRVAESGNATVLADACSCKYYDHFEFTLIRFYIS